MFKKSVVVLGRCEGCKEKIGLAHISGLDTMIVGVGDDFLSDPDIRVFCPKCHDFKKIKGMKSKKYAKNEVKRRLEEGEKKALVDWW